MEFNAFSLLLLQLSAMLGAAIILGQLAKRLGQPAVLGEIIGGLLIGVTVAGALAPSAHAWLFTQSADATAARDVVVKLGMLFFLFVAGSEVDLSDLRRIGPKALSIGLAGTLLPLAVGVAIVYSVPSLFGAAVGTERLAVALFVGLCLANSANPVLARILMDLGLLKSEVGSVAMTATIIDDLVNWTVFALILGSLGPASSDPSGGDLAMSIGAVAALVVVIVGGGRWLGGRGLRALRRRTTWPTGFLGAVAVAILLAATAAESIGLHAFLGAFLVGVALSGHDAEHREAHEVTARFALSFFAPIYFVSIAMETDFVADLDPALVIVLIVLACSTKLMGVLIGARLAGMPIDRTARAIAWGLNARGATGIVLAGVGHSSGVIDDQLFVALVLMALVTTMIAGPMMKRSMRRTDRPRLVRQRSIR